MDHIDLLLPLWLGAHGRAASVRAERSAWLAGEGHTIRAHERTLERGLPAASTAQGKPGSWLLVCATEERAAVEEALGDLSDHRRGQVLPVTATGPLLVNALERDLLALEQAAPISDVLVVGSPARLGWAVDGWLADRGLTVGRIDLRTGAHQDDVDALRRWAARVIAAEARPAPRQVRFVSPAHDRVTGIFAEDVHLPLKKWLDGKGAVGARWRAPPAHPPVDTRATMDPAGSGAGEPARVVVVGTHGTQAGPGAAWGDIRLRDGQVDASVVTKAEAWWPGAVVVSQSCFGAGVQVHSDGFGLHREAPWWHRATADALAPVAAAALAHPQGPVAWIGAHDVVVFAPDHTDTQLPIVATRDLIAWLCGPRQAGGTLGTAFGSWAERAGWLAAQLAERRSRGYQTGQPVSDQERIDGWLGVHNHRNVVLLGDPAMRVGDAVGG